METVWHNYHRYSKEDERIPRHTTPHSQTLISSVFTFFLSSFLYCSSILIYFLKQNFKFDEASSAGTRKERINASSQIKTYQLSKYKSSEQEISRSFNEGPAARPCNENKGLAYNTNLQV